MLKITQLVRGRLTVRFCRGGIEKQKGMSFYTELNWEYTHELLKFFFFFFLAVLRDMRDLSSPTRDQSHAPFSGSMES